MELKDQIVDLLKKSEPLKGGEIAEKLGVEKKDVDKAIKTLKKEETVISPKRCFYSVEK
jgi:Mn-dependent DtxR family transcriptional regulator